MKNLKIYIVEDDIFHLEDIKISLEELGYECIGHSDDPFEAQEQIANSEIDVVLMDIHLNGRVAGVQLAQRLKAQHDLSIIFTSSEDGDEIMKEAANIALTYLTKPVRMLDLKAALLMASKKKKEEVPLPSYQKELFIKHGNKLVRVALSEILFAHTDTKNYCTLVTRDERKLTFRNSIQAFYKLLDPQLFIQTHRAYIVNMSAVDSFHETDQMLQVLSYSIPVGRTFKARVYERMNIL